MKTRTQTTFGRNSHHPLPKITGPAFPKEIASPNAFDFKTRQHKGEPLGETHLKWAARVVDEDGRPVRPHPR